MSVGLRRRVVNAEQLIAEAKALKTGERRCKAIRKTGQQCAKFAIKGGTVCPTHGGSAPQVRAKANKRLLAMVEPSLIRLEALVHQDEHRPTALGAIRTVLERAGNTTPLGPLAREAAGDKDTRPIIHIGIKVGGIERPQVLIGMQIPAEIAALPALVDGPIEGYDPDDVEDGDIVGDDENT